MQSTYYTSMAKRMISQRKTPKRKDFVYGYNFTPANDKLIQRKTLFLHGVYGTKEEWDYVATSDEILAHTNTYTIDAVNHGDTSHHPEMSLDNQVQDLIDFADLHDINKMTLIGHGMGGRVAMKAGMSFPDRVQAVMSLDAPACDLRKFTNYNKRTYEIMKYVSELDIKGMPYELLKSLISKIYDDHQVGVNRTMKHVMFNDSKTQAIRWKSNPVNIFKNADELICFDQNGKYTGPIRALVSHSKRFNLSHYIEWFPKMTEEDIYYIDDAGHWIHLDNPEATIHHIVEFLQKS